jgi:signal transduction histidine kinase
MSDVSALIDDTVRSLKHQIDDKKQILEILLPEKLPVIWADPTRIVQVLVNLLSNSYKYTPEAGILQIGAEEGNNQLWDVNDTTRVVHIWVKDNGLGMTAEDQKKVFQQYFRTEYSKDMATGTGLGLNITKKLIEMQGGKIWFESEFRAGTTFHITIPVAEG